MKATPGSLNVAPRVHRVETGAAKASGAAPETSFSALLAGQTQSTNPAPPTQAATDRVNAEKQDAARDFPVASAGDRPAGSHVSENDAVAVVTDKKDSRKIKTDSASEPRLVPDAPIVLPWFGAVLPATEPPAGSDVQALSAGVDAKTPSAGSAEAAEQTDLAHQLTNGQELVAFKPAKELMAAGVNTDVANTAIPSRVAPGNAKPLPRKHESLLSTMSQPGGLLRGGSVAMLQPSTVSNAASMTTLASNVTPFVKTDATEQLLTNGTRPVQQGMQDESQSASGPMPAWAGNFQFQPILGAMTDVSVVPTSAGEGFAKQVTSQLQLWLNDMFTVADFGVQDGSNGPLQVRVELSGQEVNVHFLTDVTSERDAIGIHLERLQDMLQSQGLSLGGTSIGGSSGDGQSRSDQWPTASIRAQAKPLKGGDALSSGAHVAALAASADRTSGRQGVDVFA